MTWFVVAVAVMLAAACGFVLVPLLSRRRVSVIERGATNLSVIRDQVGELDNDLALGVLSSEQYDSARLDLDRSVLDEARFDPSGAAIPARTSLWGTALIGAVFPIAAVLLYLALGNPLALLPNPASTQAGAGTEPPAAQSIEALIEAAKAKLANEPGNVEGWVVLARTYRVLGRNDEAIAAFERAVALAPNDADLLADYADALGVIQGRSLEGRPAEVVARALRADPNHWKANALAGTLAFQRNEFAKAVEHWERVKLTVPPDSPLARSIDSSLAEARLAAKGPGAKASAPAPSAAPGAAAGSDPRNIAGTVSLAPAFSAGVSPDDTVFVYARPSDGSRMPLALVRARVRDLPLAFRLDDGANMVPTRKISDHGEVIVSARVSKSGSATPQSGDLEAAAAPVKLGERALRLVIDHRLP